MRVSLNTIKQYTDIDISVDELVKKINEQLGGVEEVINFGARYKDAVIVRIASCEKHPDADRLSICKVDDGGVVQNIERDENGYVQVVCGAPNARADIITVWLPPGSVVPATIDDKEPMVLDSREFRGVMSNGMLTAGDELAIGNSHDGIIEIDPAQWKPSGIDIQPGASFARAYGLDDTIIDIENKMFTHRPDCFGQLGVAREIAGIQHKQFDSTDWYKNVPEFGGGEGLEITVTNDAKEKVPRFMAVALKDITIKPSPLWLQCELVRLGSKPINNVVDVTNYIMLLTAQPLHAYDYDKLRGHTLGARFANKDEKIELLNGKSYTLDASDIVIIDGEGPVGLGGVMGGGNSEVSETTTNIVIECANFDMYAIRKTSMRHGLFTDAVTRFNKGQSPLQNPQVLKLAIQSIFDTAGGQQASQVFDISNDGIGNTAGTVEVSAKFINDRLGLALENNAIKQLLENVEFMVEEHDETLVIHTPFWRTDIELAEDIVEEVGRLYGFDKLPRELPRRSTKPAPKNAGRVLEQTIRETLARAGANEVLTYSFVHGNVLQKAGQKYDNSYEINNSLSPDLQYYRQSLTPSLLGLIHPNSKTGYDEFALFEINKTHQKSDGLNQEGVPVEHQSLAFIFANKKAKTGAAYYQAKRYLEYLAETLGLTLRYIPIDAPTSDAQGAPFEYRRSAWVKTADDQVIGVIGEYKHDVAQNFKLPPFVAGFEISVDTVLGQSLQGRVQYAPLSRYPSTERDICFQVATSVTYDQIVVAAKAALAESALETVVTPVDIFQAQDADTKNVTIRVKLVSHDKTLTSEEVNQVIDTIVKAVSETAGAKAI